MRVVAEFAAKMKGRRGDKPSVSGFDALDA
jgi:hypothetical protein